MGYLDAAGWHLEEVTERDPYPPGVETQTRRVYILATAGPAGSSAAPPR